MKINLNRINDDVLFECETEEGLKVRLDGSADIGGTDTAPRPMQVFLMSLASCSSIDVVTILKKMRQNVDEFYVRVDGERVDTTPRVFHTITLHYHIGGQVKQEKAQQAIDMSLEKYCSVSKMLREDIKVQAKLTILDIS